VVDELLVIAIAANLKGSTIIGLRNAGRRS
jgi:hypothetical protein